VGPALLSRPSLLLFVFVVKDKGGNQATTASTTKTRATVEVAAVAPGQG